MSKVTKLSVLVRETCPPELVTPMHLLSFIFIFEIPDSKDILCVGVCLCLCVCDRQRKGNRGLQGDITNT